MECESPKTFFEFSQIIASWLSMLKDSHTSLDPDLILWEFKKNHYLFPFMLERIEDKFYAKHFVSDKVSYGNEVLKINSLTMDSLFNLSVAFAIKKEGDSRSAQFSYATYLMGFVYNLCNNFSKTDSVLIQHVNPLEILYIRICQLIVQKKEKNILNIIVGINYKMWNSRLVLHKT